jgi:hypothetical protein
MSHMTCIFGERTYVSGFGVYQRPKESIRLSFLIDPRLGGGATLRREGGLHQVVLEKSFSCRYKEKERI